MGAISGICPVGAVAAATWVTWAASWERAGLLPRTGFRVPTVELDSTVAPVTRGVRICGRPRRTVGVVTTVAVGGPATATMGWGFEPTAATVAATPPCGPPRKRDFAAVTKVTGAGPAAGVGRPTPDGAALVATRTSDLATVGCAAGPAAVEAATAKATRGLPPIPGAEPVPGVDAVAVGPLAAVATPITFTVPLGLATTCTAPAGMLGPMAGVPLTEVGLAETRPRLAGVVTCDCCCETRLAKLVLVARGVAGVTTILLLLAIDSIGVAIGVMPFPGDALGAVTRPPVTTTGVAPQLLLVAMWPVEEVNTVAMLVVMLLTALLLLILTMLLLAAPFSVSINLWFVGKMGGLPFSELPATSHRKDSAGLGELAGDTDGG